MHGNPARIGVETALAHLTFRADGTGDVEWTDRDSTLVQGTPWLVSAISESPVSGPFLWTLENGLLNGLGAPATVAANGRLFMLGGTAQAGDGSWNQLLIAIRQP